MNAADTIETKNHLNLIRGAAALLVALAHLSQIFIFPLIGVTSGMWITLSGQLGLMAFFSLSGYLIFQSVSRNFIKYGIFEPTDFMKKRLRRIYPPLLAGLLLTALLTWIIVCVGYTDKSNYTTGSELYVPREKISFDWVNMASVFVFANNIVPGFNSPTLNGPLWSIAHEFWFYMTCAVALSVSNINKILGVITFTLIMFFSLSINDFWTLGMIVWCVAFLSAYLRTRMTSVLYLCYVIIFSLLAFSIFYYLQDRNPESWFRYRSYYLYGVIISLLLPILENFPLYPRATKITGFFPLLTKSLTNVSGYAYTLYVIHFPIFMFFFVFCHRYIDGGLTRLLFVGVIFYFTIILAKIIASVVEAEFQEKNIAGNKSS